MIRPHLTGPARCVSVLNTWIEDGEDCQLWIGPSPTGKLRVVHQMTGEYLHSAPVKESHVLAGLVANGLRNALGLKNQGVTSGSYQDHPVSEYLSVRFPACLVGLPDDHWLETPEGALQASAGILQGLGQWSLWLRGRWKAPKTTRLSGV